MSKHDRLDIVPTMRPRHVSSSATPKYGYAGQTLRLVRPLTVREQLEEIRLRITVGEYADVPKSELDILRRIWLTLYENLHQFTTVH